MIAQAARRLVRALAVAHDAGRGGTAADGRRLRAEALARRSRPPSAGRLRDRRSCSRSCSPTGAVTGTAIVADAMFRDRWAALAQVLARRLRPRGRAIAYGERWREEHVAEYYALLDGGRRGDAFFVQAANLMTLFLGLGVVLDRAVRPVRDRHRPRRLARGRAQVPDRRLGRVGDAPLRLGARLRRDRASSASTGSPPAGHAHDAMLVSGWR